MPHDESTPQLHIDSDWKAEAQAEKERLAAEERSRADERAGTDAARGSRELPEANFQTLVSVLASQAIMGLGTMQDPETKGVVIDLEGSRFSIDLLGVLEEKTKGNVTDKEAEELKQLVAELRARFVQVSTLVAQQMKAEAPGASGIGAGIAADSAAFGSPASSQGSPGAAAREAEPGATLRMP